MRVFHQFQCRFCDKDEITGKKKYSYGKKDIDLLSVICYGSSKGRTFIGLTCGDSFKIKISFDEYDIIHKKARRILFNANHKCQS